MFDSAAPSRPPSRASFKPGEQPPAYVDGTQQSHELVFSYADWGEVAPADPATKDQAMSTGREAQSDLNGFALAGATTFGPSTRSDEETKGWIIDVATTSTKEIVLTPDAQDRTRTEGIPSYLRPSLDRPLLAAVLKILHSVPMAREALLNRSVIAPDYGFQSDWWNGDTIFSPSLRTVGDPAVSEDSIHEDALLRELQRLMAFLSATCRAYGSVDSLVSISSFKQDDLAIELLDAWHKATETKDHEATLLYTFTSTAKRTYRNAKPWERDFTVLTIKNATQGLYQSMDDMLWSDEKEDGWEDTILTATGHVVCLQVREAPSEGPCGLKAPATLFLDRYTLQAAPRMKELRRRRDIILGKMHVIERQRSAILSHGVSTSASQNLDARNLISAVSKYTEDVLERRVAQDGGGGNGSPYMELKSVVSELNTLTARVEARLKRRSNPFDFAAVKLMNSRDECGVQGTRGPAYRHCGCFRNSFR